MPDRSNLYIWWNFILLSILDFFQIIWKYMLNPNAGKIHLKTNKSAQLCRSDTPETYNWLDTPQMIKI